MGKTTMSEVTLHGLPDLPSWHQDRAIGQQQPLWVRFAASAQGAISLKVLMHDRNASAASVRDAFIVIYNLRYRSGELICACRGTILILNDRK